MEWPEKAEGTLPPFDIEIHLKAGVEESERQITLTAWSDQGATVLEKTHFQTS